MQKYVCNVCGYEYNPVMGDRTNGVKSGTDFDKLPKEWICPVCGKGKNSFSAVK